MSTSCQVGFYETPEQPLDKPSTLVYRHSDGYPDGTHGVLARLAPFAKDFHEKWGLSDAEYAGAQYLYMEIAAETELRCQYRGYGICGDHGLHNDISYYYRVDPSGIAVYIVHDPDAGFEGLSLKR